jgi:hypothetical protein
MIHLNEVITIRTNIGLVSEPLNLNYYLETAQKVLSEQVNAKRFCDEHARKRCY